MLTATLAGQGPATGAMPSGGPGRRAGRAQAGPRPGRPAGFRLPAARG